MNGYVSGNMIRILREQKNLTQKELGEKLFVSDKAISKWETGKGLPDISLLEPLSYALGVSLPELFHGECVTNNNKHFNVMKSLFYVCPVCGNVVISGGEGVFSCCGITLPKLMVEENDEMHTIKVKVVENEYFVKIENHPMTKKHYLSFIAYLSWKGLQFVKLYPESEPETRLNIQGGGGIIFAYCNQHGLFSVKV